MSHVNSVDEVAYQHKYYLAHRVELAASQKEYSRTHRVELAASQRARRIRHVADPHFRANQLWHAAKHRKKHGVTIDTAWIEQRILRGVCEVSGLPLVMSQSGREPFSPSLDRIDNSKGYTPENTKLVCWLYNRAKGHWTHEVIMQLAGALCTASKK